MKPTWPDKSAAEDHHPAGQSHLISIFLILIAAGALSRFQISVASCLEPFKKFICDAAFIIAAVLPFFLIIRWRLWGLIASVLGGWALIYYTEASFTWESDMMPIYIAYWKAFGWLYMLVWCLPIYLIVILSRWFQRVRQRPG